MKKIVLFASVAMMLALPVFVFAQVGPQPPLSTPPTPIGGGTALTLVEVENFIRRIASFLITVSLVIAVIFIIWGGISYMVAGADEAKAGTARTRIWNGIIGALVVLAVGVILQTLSGLVARTFFN